MTIPNFINWLDHAILNASLIYAKRLSANDTGLTEANQVGIYFPKQVIFSAIPSLNTVLSGKNTDFFLTAHIESHEESRKVRAIWYNNRVRLQTGTRDETRITQWGGKTSPLQNPESTGAIAVFAFFGEVGKDATECRVWVCRNAAETIALENRIGDVEPGEPVTLLGGGLPFVEETESKCWLSEEEIPPEWMANYPHGRDIAALAASKRILRQKSPDARLISRRNCEFEIYRSIEHAHLWPQVKKGFSSLEEFLKLASSASQRRRSRGGHSLEYHAERLFSEEGLKRDRDFSHNPKTEGEKQPDFIFPSSAAYNDPAFPKSRLRMLAAKTTLRDRWRQILNEADRIEVKHLLTLQEGLSLNQFTELEESKVKLVVPKALHEKFPPAVQPKLMTLSEFISDVKLHCSDAAL